MFLLFDYKYFLNCRHTHTLIFLIGRLPQVKAESTPDATIYHFCLANSINHMLNFQELNQVLFFF